MPRERPEENQPETAIAEKETRRNYIETNDVVAAKKFLEKIYDVELTEGGYVTSEIVGANLDHSARVAENAIWIAKGEKLNQHQLELAGICHDCGKLNHNEPGGIDTFDHHKSSARLTYEFLLERGIDFTLAQDIREMVFTHSTIPFIKAKRPDIIEPASKEALALRDADILDQIDIWGFKKIVEIRQNPDSPFYKQDGGDFKKAMASALKSAHEGMEILHTETAKKIAKGYHSRQEKLLTKLKTADVKTLSDFQKVFEKFVSSEKI